MFCRSGAASGAADGLGSFKQIVTLAIVACLAGSPVLAEDKPVDENPPAPNLLEEGAKMFMRGLAQELDPALERLQNFTAEMLPMLEKLQEQIGDFSQYHMPEVLPNGDIIIRRKQPKPGVDEENGQIEL